MKNVPNEEKCVPGLKSASISGGGVKNVSENLLGLINILKHHPKKHQVCMKKAQIIL